MADFTKAGLDKGDLKKELENTLISTRMLYRTYSATIEDLTREELLHDLEEYRHQMERSIIPLVERAEATKDARLVDLAYEIRYTHERLLELIRQRLSAF
ncbi:MAG: hypothetical protein NZ851_05240 [Aquificaceae bacterium]|nr:hypothetical protein [Aquificaceae bacterium]